MINIMLYNNEKYDKAISKVVGIISKLISNQYKSIIERKIFQKV